LDSNAIALLNKLKNCNIVLSSSWRYAYSSCIESLRYNGLLLPVIDKTPDLFSERVKDDPSAIFNDDLLDVRGAEIDLWLKRNPCDNYVIFDDDTDMLDEQLSHFVHVNAYYGLTQKDIDTAKKIINNGTIS